MIPSERITTVWATEGGKRSGEATTGPGARLDYPDGSGGSTPYWLIPLMLHFVPGKFPRAS